MTLSRRSTIKAIGVVGGGSTLAGTALAVSEHQDDERDSEAAPDDEEEVGAIRVGHFSPDAPNVDVYVDDQQILSDVGYDELSPYLEIEPGTYTLTITEVDGNEPVYEDTIVIGTEYYTAAAIGELEATGDESDIADESDLATDEAGNATDSDDSLDLGDGNATDDNATEPETGSFIQDGNETDANETGTEDGGLEAEGDTATDDTEDTEDDTADETGTFEVLLLVDDSPEDVQEGTSHVRLVHASPDAPTVDVANAENGALIFEGVSFGEPSGYVPVDPGVQALEIFETSESDLEAAGDENTDDETAADTETGSFVQDGNETAANETGTETQDGGLEAEGDDVISQEEPVASVEVDLEEGMAYTAYAIGYLAEADDLTADDGAVEGDESEGDADNGTEETDTAASIQDDNGTEYDGNETQDSNETEYDNQTTEDGDDLGLGDESEAEDGEDDEDDRSFEVRVAVDGTNEEDDDLEDQPDEAEPDRDEIENGDDYANETDGNGTDDYANETDDNETAGEQPAAADD